MIFWRVKSLDAILATAEKKSLHRSLSVWQLTLLGVGAIIGTGIFVLTAEAAQKAGPGMLLALFVPWRHFATLSFLQWCQCPDLRTPILMRSWVSWWRGWLVGR